MNDPRPPEGYWLNAVVPLGPAKAELLKLLREAEPTTYSQVCRDFAVMRAQELCLTYTNDELAVRDGLFVWTVYNFELVTCLRRVLAKTKWRHIWTIMSEAQCAFVDEVEKIRQRRCAQHFISESPAHGASVTRRPLAGNQENIMSDTTTTLRGKIIKARVTPWLDKVKTPSEIVTIHETIRDYTEVEKENLRAMFINAGQQILALHGVNGPFDKTAGVEITISINPVNE